MIFESGILNLESNPPDSADRPPRPLDEPEGPPGRQFGSGPCLRRSPGPGDFDPRDAPRLAEPEADGRLGRGEIAAPRDELAGPDPPAGRDADPGAEGRPAMAVDRVDVQESPIA